MAANGMSNRGIGEALFVGLGETVRAMRAATASALLFLAAATPSAAAPIKVEAGRFRQTAHFAAPMHDGRVEQPA